MAPVRGRALEVGNGRLISAHCQETHKKPPFVFAGYYPVITTTTPSTKGHFIEHFVLSCFEPKSTISEITMVVYSLFGGMMTAADGYFRRYSRWFFFLKRKPFLFLGLALLLLTGVFGCGGTIRKAEYPVTWPSSITSSLSAGCIDISGTYKTSNGLPLLPFFVFGITDEASLDWRNLIQVYKERLLADPDGTTVTIAFPDPEKLEVIVAVDGITVAKQLLTRTYQSESASVMFGQHKRSFRCEPDSVVINSSYVHDWDVYSLPYEEKKRRYRRMFGAVGPLGVSEGYFYFSKTISGSLVARVSLYGCYPCRSLDEYWQRWEPILSPTPK